MAGDEGGGDDDSNRSMSSEGKEFRWTSLGLWHQLMQSVSIERVVAASCWRREVACRGIRRNMYLYEMVYFTCELKATVVVQEVQLVTK